MRTVAAPLGKSDPAVVRRWLAARLEEIEASGGPSGGVVRAPTGWEGVDDALGGGLRTHGAHEWFTASSGARGREWSAPLCVLTHVARACAASLGSEEAPGWIAWVGRRVWPYAPALARLGGATMLRRSLLIDADARSRVWAMDAALRTPSMIVVADGAGLALAETRRLQLAGEAGGSVALVARPWWDRGEPSAALTRWAVRSAPMERGAQRWEIELTARKGARLSGNNTRRWLVERSRANGGLSLSAPLGERSRPAALAS